MPHSTRTVQKKGSIKKGKKTSKNKAKKWIDKKRPKIKKGQKTKKRQKSKKILFPYCLKNRRSKNGHIKEMKTTRQKTSKNNDFPGDTTQKIDKIQNRAKNVKKHEKTRDIEIQYIYI